MYTKLNRVWTRSESSRNTNGYGYYGKSAVLQFRLGFLCSNNVTYKSVEWGPFRIERFCRNSACRINSGEQNKQIVFGEKGWSGFVPGLVVSTPSVVKSCLLGEGLWPGREEGRLLGKGWGGSEACAWQGDILRSGLFYGVGLNNSKHTESWLWARPLLSLELDEWNEVSGGDRHVHR
jgi:hypothetical protein